MAEGKREPVCKGPSRFRRKIQNDLWHLPMGAEGQATHTVTGQFRYYMRVLVQVEPPSNRRDLLGEPRIGPGHEYGESAHILGEWCQQALGNAAAINEDA